MSEISVTLEGYDGLAGDRSLALEALQRNKQILKTISEIEQKIVLCVASGGGSKCVISFDDDELMKGESALRLVVM